MSAQYEWTWPIDRKDHEMMCDEIDRLRAERDEVWKARYEKLKEVGDATIVWLESEVGRLKAALDAAQLQTIEALNPGIDMDKVRHFRASADSWPYQTDGISAEEAT